MLKILKINFKTVYGYFLFLLIILIDNLNYEVKSSNNSNIKKNFFNSDNLNSLISLSEGNTFPDFKDLPSIKTIKNESNKGKVDIFSSDDQNRNHLNKWDPICNSKI